jgi:hypothetical protein
VYTLYGLDPRLPVDVQIRADDGSVQPYRYERLLGFETVTWSESAGGAVTAYRSDVVRIDRATLENRSTLTRVLVHEFTHVLQSRRGWDETLVAAVPAEYPAGSRVYDYVVEGVAVRTVTAYARAYDENWSSPVFGIYRTGTPFERLVAAPYAVGARYARERFQFDDPESYFADPPLSVSAFRHGRPPGADVPPNLSVGVTTRERDWTVAETTRLGELRLELALSTHLNRTQSRQAAIGWETDQFLRLKRKAGVGYVWTVVFTDARNATEFTRAARRYVAERRQTQSTAPDGATVTYRVERVDDRSVALLFGNASFVQTATLSVNTASGPSTRAVRREPTATDHSPLRGTSRRATPRRALLPAARR